jgi:hypothetical protein
MAILVPQSALDKAIAEDKKLRGILDAIPPDCFTIIDLVAKGMVRRTARDWAIRNAVRVGTIGVRAVYRLKTKQEREKKS